MAGMTNRTDEEQLQEIKKCYKLLVEFFALNEIADDVAHDTMLSYSLNILMAKGFEPERFDALLDKVKVRYRNYIEKN